MKRNTVLAVLGITVILIAGLLVLRQPHASLAQQYDFYTVTRKDLSKEVATTGTVLALDKQGLYPSYEGTVDKVYVKAGDRVKQGDVLIALSSSPLKDQAQDAGSALKQAQLNLDAAAGQAATEVALNGVTTRNALQLESYYHQIELYKEQVKQAEQRLDTLNTGSSAGGAGGTSDNDRLLIRAPFDGEMAWVNVTPGDKVSTQTLLATVLKPNSLGVEAQVDQNDISALRAGQQATVVGKDPSHTQNPGLVTAISLVGSGSGETTQSGQATDGVVYFPVQLKLAGQTQGLRPGMSVDVTIMADQRPGVLAIPAGSVTQRNGQDFVNVRQGEKVVPVAVKLGVRYGRYQEVKAGLSEGDRIAVARPAATLAGAVGQGQTGRRAGFAALGGPRR